MAHGGKRSGSGRKVGSATTKTRAIADAAAAASITPLEVMLFCMRHFFEKKDYVLAAGFAKDAARFVHPCLQAVQHTGDKDHPIEHVVVYVPANEREGNTPAEGAAGTLPVLVG